MHYLHISEKKLTANLEFYVQKQQLSKKKKQLACFQINRKIESKFLPVDVYQRKKKKFPEKHGNAV